MVSVRAYLDRSGQKAAAFVTLAAFAGPDHPIWAEFERGWAETLSSGFLPVPYFHVVEALGCRYGTPFSRALGWKRQHVWELIGKLLSYTSKFNHGRLTMHSCIVDMNAWRSVSASGCILPSEVELCNRYVSNHIVAMFAKNVLDENAGREIIQISPDDCLNFVFDRNEDFYRPFHDYVNEQKLLAESTGRNSIWQLVDGVGEADMKHTPGLQAADLLAWAINRENTVTEGEQGEHVARILRQIVMWTHKEYDHKALMREFCKPNGKDELDVKKVSMTSTR